MKKIFLLPLFLFAMFIPVAAQTFNRVLDTLDDRLNFYQKAEIINRVYGDGKGKNRSGYKQWKRWEWFASHHLGNDGNVENFQERNAEVLAARNAAIVQGVQINSNSGNWMSSGHTGHTGGTSFAMQGRVNCLAFDPFDLTIIYAGTAGGGIWKSYNAGVNWTNISANLPVTTISSLTVAPDGNTIFALTGDIFIAGGPYLHNNGIGVLKSNDAGVTWQRTGLMFDQILQYGGGKIGLHPGNPNIVYAGTSNGLYRSLDAGINWTKIAFGQVTDFEFKPGDPNILYYTRYNSNEFNKINLTNLTITTIYITTAFPIVPRMEIGVTPANPNAVYLLVGPGYNTGGAGTPNGTAMYNGLYYSPDAGGSFSKRNDNIDIFALNGDQSWYDIVIHVNPINENNVIIGGVRLYSSLDGGVNFTLINDGANDNSVHHDCHALERNPLDASLYLGNDGGVHRSANSGVTWNPISNGMVINEYYRISGIQGNVNLLIGGTQDNGVFIKNSASTDFYTPYILLDMMDNIIDISNPLVMYTCSQNGGLNVSSNGGNSFNSVAVPNGGGNWVTPIAQLPSSTGHNTLFYGSNSGILRTINAGVSWTNINGQNSADCIAIGTDGTNFNLVASRNSRMMISNNPTAVTPVWTTVTTPNFNNISSIAVNPANKNEIWFTCSGYSPSDKVYRSGDGGATWSNLSLSLPNIPVYSIVFGNNTNSPSGAVYIGTELGIYYTDNTIVDWEPFYNGLPMCLVTDLFVNYAGNRIYASTYGRGIWQSDLYNSCPGPLFLTGTVFGNTFFQSSSFIETTQQLEGSAGNDLRLKAPDRINLKPGFYSRSGSFLHAALGNCGSGVISKLDTIPIGKQIP